MDIASVNPSTGECLRTYPEMALPEMLAILQQQHLEAGEWSSRSFSERAECFMRLAANLRSQSREYAACITREMGKPIAQAEAEIEKSALVCEYYAEQGAALLADEAVPGVAREAFISYQPLGMILLIMPWNFPFWQVLRAAVPTMMAGNCIALKHASNVPECALTLEAAMHNAGFPVHAFRTLLVGSKAATVALASPFIHGVAFTGSTAVGQTVAAQAGTLIKKAVLELGGNDAYLVLEDANIDCAVESCVEGRLGNCGQSCIAVKRIICCPGVMDAFVETLLKRIEGIEFADPMDAKTRLGPMARVDLRDSLHRQVMDSVEAGARLLCGGYVPDRPGAWYPPTLLSDVPKNAPAYSEELFGPVLTVMRAADEEDAIRIANDSHFGLAGGIFSRDVERARKVAREQLQCGTVTINGFSKSHPKMPFGGIKQSGFGRELGPHGIREFVNVKAIQVH